MKVYIASSFDQIDNVDIVARYLENRGHTIAVKWWATDGFSMHDKKTTTVSEEDFYNDPICRAIFERDFAGVQDADVFILVADLQTPRAYNGANIEYGIAVAAGKPCFSLGKLARCALYYPVVQCRALSELAEKIEAIP